MVFTYNSKHDIYGNRLNLVVNYETKEYYFYGCDAFNKGNVINNLGIREVNKQKKELDREGYKKVDHATATMWL